MKTETKVKADDPAGNLDLWMHAENVPWVMNKIVSVRRVGRMIRPADILRVVAEIGDVPFETLLTAWRASHVARLRQISMLIIREQCPNMTLSQIAKIFDRDHTTIIHGIKTARKAVAEHAVWSQVYDDARGKLGIE